MTSGSAGSISIHGGLALTSRRLLLISVAAVAVRGALAIWQQVHPFAFNDLVQNFYDFHAYYLWELSQLAQGHVPYRDFAYSYPPLFLYALYPFYAINVNLAAVPIVLSDALTAPLLYLIVRRVSSERAAVIASLAYVVLPTSLVYEGVSWMSEQPMLFFLLLSLYLLREDRPQLSALCYAVSLLLKQDALFILPAYLFWMAKLQGLGKSLKNMSLVVVILVAASAPFLILTPRNYLGSLSIGIFNGILHPTTPALLPPGYGGGLSLGTFQTTDITLPSLTCSNIVNNVFEVSRFCTGLEQNGQTLTNWILLPESPEVVTFLRLFALLMFSAAALGLLLVPKNVRPILSMAVSYAGFTTLLLLYSDLGPFKYYLVPLFALILACSLDLVSVGIAVLIPALVVLTAFGYLTIISPIAEIQILIAYYYLRMRRSAGTSLVRSDPHPQNRTR